MQVIEMETRIAAPPERCFLLSLSVDLHMQSAGETGERAVAGVMHGIMSPGETVTWRGRHFGLMLMHESRIAGYDRPHYFQDVMARGQFRSFEHDHYFDPDGDAGTVMRDRLTFSAPAGVIGLLAEKLFLRRYMVAFLQRRNREIKQIAESPQHEWLRFVSEGY